MDKSVESLIQKLESEGWKKISDGEVTHMFFLKRSPLFEYVSGRLEIVCKYEGEVRHFIRCSMSGPSFNLKTKKLNMKWIGEWTTLSGALSSAAESWTNYYEDYKVKEKQFSDDKKSVKKLSKDLYAYNVAFYTKGYGWRLTVHMAKNFVEVDAWARKEFGDKVFVYCVATQN